VLLALAVDADAATLNVCTSGCAFSLPSAAVAAAKSGDTVHLAKATYTDCLVRGLLLFAAN
jgi:hypothetical protein